MKIVDEEWRRKTKSGYLRKMSLARLRKEKYRKGIKIDIKIVIMKITVVDIEVEFEKPWK